MSFKHFLFVLLPAVAYGAININIKADRSLSSSSVTATGKDVAIISDTERDTFQLSESNLKRGSKLFAGEEFSSAYLKRPTPWEDVYKKFGWKEVTRTIQPVRARIVGINAIPVSIATAEYANEHSSIKAKYNTAVQQTVTETISHTWSKGGELSTEQEIHYGIEFGKGFSAGGSTKFSVSASWGNDTTDSRVVTIGTTSNVEVEIAPGGEVLATLSASRGTMEIEIDYEATLDGKVFCNYGYGFKGHKWWAFPLSILQELAKLPTTVKSTEKISIGFYTNARIVVSNLKTNDPIEKMSAGVVRVKSNFKSSKSKGKKIKKGKH